MVKGERTTTPPPKPRRHIYSKETEMENLALAIVLYVAIVAIAYCPNKTTATDPLTTPIDYFPEVEEVSPQSEFVATVPAQPKAKTISTLLREEATKKAIAVEPVANDLSTLPIRALYARAKGKVKNYKKLSRAQLVQALA